MVSLPYKCHCEAVYAEAISYFADISTQNKIAAPPKNKCGGSQHLRRAPARCDIIFEMYGRKLMVILSITEPNLFKGEHE
jgi:hypothetical protein